MSKKIRKIPLLFKKLGLNFRRRNLKKLQKAIFQRKRFYSDSVDSNFILKVKIQRSKRVKIQVEKEIEIYKIFQRQFREKLRFFPKIINSGKENSTLWLLKKREIGKLAGKMDNDFGMKKSFLLKVSPSCFVNIINLYRNIKPNIPLTKRGGEWYLHDFHRYRKSFFKKFINSKLNQNLFSFEDLKLTERILEENKKFLDKEAKFLSHGDLYPNNLILNKERKLIILDWELANFNNLAFDVAFVYLLAHQLPVWQKRFLNIYSSYKKEKNKFRRLFNLSLISLTVRFAAHCYFHIKDKKEVFSILKKHLKVLKNTISKFKL